MKSVLLFSADFDLKIEIAPYSVLIIECWFFHKLQRNIEILLRAAHFCKVFHNHSLDPDEIRRLLKRFEDTDGFNIDY